MDRIQFRKLVGGFSGSATPLWICSTCGKGILELIEPSLNIEETGPSRASHAHEAFDYEWVNKRFSGLLKCSSKLCGDIVSIAGVAVLEEESDWEAQQQSYYDFLVPLFIYPPPLYFSIPTECAETIRDSILRSFSLLLLDIEASANAIRVTIEQILNNHHIAKTTVSKGKRKLLTLHSRIERFQLKDQETGNLLLAIKWIGNTGSHIGKLTNEDIYDAYEILEQALYRLYSTSARRAQRNAAKIILNKGPIPRCKKGPVF